MRYGRLLVPVYIVLGLCSSLVGWRYCCCLPQCLDPLPALSKIVLGELNARACHKKAHWFQQAAGGRNDSQWSTGIDCS